MGKFIRTVTPRKTVLPHAGTKTVMHVIQIIEIRHRVMLRNAYKTTYRFTPERSTPVHPTDNSVDKF